MGERDVQTFFKTPAKPKPKYRKPLPFKSEKREAEQPWRDRIKARVLARDGGCYLHGETPWECDGPLDAHHRRKASDTGAYSMRNLVALCRRHNDMIECEPDWFRHHWPWLVVRQGDQEWASLGKNRRRRDPGSAPRSVPG